MRLEWCQLLFRPRSLRRRGRRKSPASPRLRWELQQRLSSLSFSSHPPAISLHGYLRPDSFQNQVCPCGAKHLQLEALVVDDLEHECVVHVSGLVHVGDDVPDARGGGYLGWRLGLVSATELGHLRLELLVLGLEKAVCVHELLVGAAQLGGFHVFSIFFSSSFFSTCFF